MTDEILKEVSKDERMRYLRESREYAQMEIDWGLQLAEKRGIEQARRANALEMKADGVSIDKIMQYTKLSRTVIEAL